MQKIMLKACGKCYKKKKPDDYVICSGKSYSVKEFINLVADELKMIIVWKGKGLKEVGYFNKKPIIRINRKYFRPLEVNHLKGDSSKARKILKWTPKNSIKNLIKKMINFEINEIQNI